MLAVLVPLAGPAYSDDGSGCLGCHTRDQLKKMEPSDIVAAVKNPDLPVHAQFAKLSDEELQQIAKSLTGCDSQK
jgi:hypothetical protein